MYRITNSACHKTGEVLYAVEEYCPEEKSWGVVKVFVSKTKAEEYKQTLEAYGKEKVESVVRDSSNSQRNHPGRGLSGVFVGRKDVKACGESAHLSIEPDTITPYPAVPEEYGVLCEGYGGYRIPLAPFKGMFSAVRFRGSGNSNGVVSGYVVDNRGYVESVAAESDEDGYATLPLTACSHALYASVPMVEGNPVWDTITVQFSKGESQTC